MGSNEFVLAFFGAVAVFTAQFAVRHPGVFYDHCMKAMGVVIVVALIVVAYDAGVGNTYKHLGVDRPEDVTAAQLAWLCSVGLELLIVVLMLIAGEINKRADEAAKRKADHPAGRQ